MVTSEIGWTIDPLATRVMAGEFSKRNTDTNQILFIPSEPFQRPEQPVKYLSPMMPLPSCKKLIKWTWRQTHSPSRPHQENIPGAASARVGSSLFRLPHKTQSASVISSRITNAGCFSFPLRAVGARLRLAAQNGQALSNSFSHNCEYFSTFAM